MDFIGNAFGAGRENRTLMVLPPRDFESRASTSSAIPARKSAHYPVMDARQATADIA
jgi:hypothetical protein